MRRLGGGELKLRANLDHGKARDLRNAPLSIKVLARRNRDKTIEGRIETGD